METVEIGSTWLHKNGNIYEVLLITNKYADDNKKDEYPLTVVYQGPDGKIWSKPVYDFIKSRVYISGPKEL